jgi:beta-N-acetylhexosaminidase
MARLKRYLALALVVAMLIPLAPLTSSRAQEEDQVMRLMGLMSDSAKVGQLFLVTFPGSEVVEDGVIAELIRDYHLGGVVLLPENDNVVNEGNTRAQVTTLISQLQGAAWAATQPVTETVGGSEEEGVPPGPFIPLFVAVSHEGNGMPFTGIVSGTTPLPSQMALGATWNPAYAETVGQVVGQELRAFGINMLFGPSLDVLDSPRPGSTGDLGVRAFGGNPFWVGQMGQAYIRGVHTGGEGQVAIIAKHFPGIGASDRSLDEEISTVQRTLEQLRETDLAPFSAAAQAEDPLARPDGVLVSHIRFRGLEGTRPVSVDSQVLQRLLALPELLSWREQGGVTVSDELGVRALRRFYDPAEESFNSRHIARDAFLAGNDLLLLSQFGLSDDWDDQVANVKSTVTFFREQYNSDPSFQTAVDAAVARILRLKLALYGGVPEVALTQPDLESTGEQTESPRDVLSTIGRDALTLLFPSTPDQVPPPPTIEDTIVIFTDSREGQPCATCAPLPHIDPLALRDTILQLYGPDATGQISPSSVTAFTFDQLEEYLSTSLPLTTPSPTGEEEPTLTPRHPVELALQDADWVIFGMLNPTGDLPQSGVVRRFLAEQADALRHPHLVVLAYSAPYHLDATEISKLSAYYAAYSRIDSFIEASVRALFGEFAPIGAPPVSVAGINYSLLVQVSPHPEQTIAVDYRVRELPEEGEPPPEPPEEGEPTPEPPQPQMGDELELRTGVIVDHNGHPVPDGTPVQFIFTYPREGLEHSIIETTLDGVAETTVMLDRTGQLDISLQTDPVPRTIVLQITIPEGEQSAIILTPTPFPTTTPTRTPTPTITPEPTSVPEQTPNPTPGLVVTEPEEQPASRAIGVQDLLLALAVILLIGGIEYYAVRLNNRSVSQGLRLAVWSVIGGLALYLAYALRLPGAVWLRERGGVWAAGLVALLGSVMPLAVVGAADQWRRLGHRIRDWQTHQS